MDGSAQQVSTLSHLSKYFGEILGAICGGIVGMFQEEFPPGLSYQVRVPAKCLSVVWLEHSEPVRDLSPLRAGVLLGVTFGVVPPRGVLSTGSGEGCHLLGLGDCLGTGVGEMAEMGCSSAGGSSVAELVEATEVFAPIRCGRK